MALVQQIDRDMVAAMRAQEAERLSVLRMIKTAFKNKEIENRRPLADPEAIQTLTTMVKQRNESIEAFNKGNRPELAAKEAREIAIIEAYMPKAASEDEIRSLVQGVIAELTASGSKPTPKEMGTVIKAVQAKVQSTGGRADGKQVSDIVKAELAR